MTSSMWKAVFSDMHFWVPLIVLVLGVGLLIVLH
jgi:hypothetical protein